MSLRAWIAAARSAFWVVPTGCCLAALALGLVVPEIDEALGADDRPYLFGGGPEGARSLLSAITTSMISFTGLVFSITVVALQLASSQFSPRVLRTFLRSRVTQWALGVFTATFVYAVVVLRSVRGNVAVQPFVPQFGVTGAFLLLLCSVGLFIAYIHHITRSIQITTILGSIGAETRALVADHVPEADAHPSTDALVPDLPPGHPVPARAGGVVSHVDRDALLDAATRAGATIRLSVGPGEYVPHGGTIAEVVDGDVEDDLVRRAVRLSQERAMVEDVAFGFRQLVDIAERALSSGVNDPTTAVQAIDQIHDVLRMLAGRPDPARTLCDERGIPRVLLREPTFGDHLDLVVDEILQYGSDALQVRQRVGAMLADLRTVVGPERDALVAAKQRRLAALSARQDGSGDG